MMPGAPPGMGGPERRNRAESEAEPATVPIAPLVERFRRLEGEVGSIDGVSRQRVPHLKRVS